MTSRARYESGYVASEKRIRGAPLHFSSVRKTLKKSGD
jgi:hypothetical protein